MLKYENNKRCFTKAVLSWFRIKDDSKSGVYMTYID